MEVIEGADRIDRLLETGEPVILAFWHNRAILGANFLIQALLRNGYRLVRWPAVPGTASWWRGSPPLTGSTRFAARRAGAGGRS